MKIEEDEMLVSFDVSSLFINIPVDEAVRVICDKLQDGQVLQDRSTHSPDWVAELLETCLRSTCFSYRGAFYEQLKGAAMGSAISAAVVVTAPGMLWLCLFWDVSPGYRQNVDGVSVRKSGKNTQSSKFSVLFTILTRHCKHVAAAQSTVHDEAARRGIQ